MRNGGEQRPQRGPQPLARGPFGRRLLALRRSAWDGSAERAARALGVSVDHYRRLEAGARGATETVARLVDALERSEPQAVVVDVVRDALRRRRGCFSGEDLGRLEEAFGRLRDRRGVRAAREALRLARVGDGRGDAP